MAARREVVLGLVLHAVGGNLETDLVVGEVGRDRTFDGQLDELRLSNVARSADWILTQYRDHDDPAGFVTVGAPL